MAGSARRRSRLRNWGAVLLGGQLLIAPAYPQSIDAGSVAGHARDLVRQAVAAEHGEGVPKDPLRAASLYCAAAALGDAEAMYALGWMYANGRGVPHSDAYAGTLFAMAAFAGDPYAKRMERYTGDYTGEIPECLKTTVAEADAAGDEARDDRLFDAFQGQRREAARLLAELAPRYGISPRLALAIAMTESNLDPAAVSPKNAMGIMQLIPETAERFNVRKPFDPKENIKGGLAYLRWLLAYFKGNVALAAAGYNAGEGAVDRYKGVPPYRETRDYVERVLSLFKAAEHPYDSAVVAPSPILTSFPAGGRRMRR